jgi:hypothetical protein
MEGQEPDRAHSNQPQLHPSDKVPGLHTAGTFFQRILLHQTPKSGQPTTRRTTQCLQTTKVDQRNHPMHVGFRIRTLEAAKQQQTWPCATPQQKQMPRSVNPARELLDTQTDLPPRYRKMVPTYAKLIKKRTKNLKTWVNMSQEFVHHLLNVKNLPDNDPNNNPLPETTNHLNTTDERTAHTSW